MTIDRTAAEDQLLDRVDRLTAMVDSLQGELASLKAQADSRALRPTHQSEPDGSRRNLLKLAGGAAVAAAAGSALLGGARPAAAATGSTMTVGHRNYAQNITRINNSSTVLSTVDSPLSTEKTLFWADNRASVLADAVGVRGDGLASGAGVDGYGGTGVRGTGTTDGVGGSGPFGVRGTGTIIGVVGVASAAGGIGVGATGQRAAVLLTSGTGSAPPSRADAHTAGEIDLDANSTVWLCVADGSPGQWRKIGGPTTAGAFHAIDPVRVFDSRWAGNTRLSNGQNRLISVADGRTAAGVVNAPNAVPVGATAIAYNITVTLTSGAGFLSVTPGSSAGFTSSSINWSADGQNLANGLIVGLDATRQIRVFCGGVSTDYVVDVTGYFR